MDMVKKFSEKKSIHKQRFKEAEEEMNIQKTLEERQKSSNRRELERYYKEKEEAQVKVELDKIRKKNNQEMWSSGSHNILKQKNDILKNDRPILKEKNIFLKGRNDIPLSNGGDMFFKW